MENNGKSYLIIDEPKSGALSSLVLPPLVILFLSVLVPLFWQPPAMGKYWMPLVWAVFNGYALGSFTLKKEILYGVGGLILMIVQVMSLSYAMGSESLVYSAEAVAPYARIFLNATLFLTLYLIIFTQSASYEIHEYMKGDESS